MTVSKKIRNNIEGGLWTGYGNPEDDYVAVAFETAGPTGEVYVVSYHHGLNSAFARDSFSTLEELEAHMRKVGPDLRRWHVQ